MQKLYTLYINKNPVEATWAPIGITIGLFMIFVVPFSYQKDMSSLSWLSMLSIATFGVIFVFVFAIGVKTPNTPSNYAPLDGTKFISAFGTLSFAFVCTDSIFPVYQNLKNRTPGRWDKVVHITMLSLGLLYASFAITCYFLIPFLGDYVLNSESITNLMETNIAKILLAITLLLTYLSNIHVSRTYIYAVIERAIKPLSEISNKNFKILHGCVTTMLIVVTILLGIYLNDLLFIVNMTGLISSTAVGFIIPTMIIFKVKTMKKVSGDFKNAFTGSLSFRKRLLYILHFLFPIFIFIFGLIGFAAGAPLEIINFVEEQYLMTTTAKTRKMAKRILSRNNLFFFSVLSSFLSFATSIS
ncbi:hypothetical protein MHBO_000311 [Bonamia ostreae]|uniref:Amino acid transporter transmembrane domain-containing protein n=1 Tax=Bonamia ostreae TaxID=126728 RepID=A0ABV2AFB5_9EUKA